MKVCRVLEAAIQRSPKLKLHVGSRELEIPENGGA